ncbi:MAG: glycosyltransferase family 39 protein [Patescibacteria group bacterium]
MKKRTAKSKKVLVSKTKRGFAIWLTRFKKIKPQSLFDSVMARSDNYWLGVMALGVIISRWIGKSEYLFSTDSALYALALDHYDISMHQPHPPGYALYILFAKGFYLLIQDANLALVIVSIIFSVLAFYAVFYLAKLIYGRKVAWLSTIMLITGPLFWFYGQVALNYACDAFFSAWAGIYLYRAATDTKNYKALLWASLILAIGGGFRPTLIIFMVPLWLWTIWRQRSWRGLLINISIMLGGTLAWLFPAMWLSGGLLEFWQALSSILLGKAGLYSFTVFDQGLAKLAWYAKLIWNNLLLNFGLATFVTITYLASWLAPRAGERKLNLLNLWFWCLWVIPAMLFYLLIVFTIPGYLLVVLPALTILVAVATIGLIESLVAAYHVKTSQSLLITSLITVLAISIAGFNIFTYVKPSATVAMQKSTYPVIEVNNRLWRNVIPAIRNKFNPQSSLIALESPFLNWGFPQFEYYLPEYPVYIHTTWGVYNPDNKKWMLAYRHQWSLVDWLEILPTDESMIIIRNKWNIPTGAYSKLALGDGVGYLAYYDLGVPGIRELLNGITDVKVKGLAPITKEE